MAPKCELELGQALRRRRKEFEKNALDLIKRDGTVAEC